MSLNLVERYYYTTYLLYSLIYLTVQLTISQFFDFQREPLLSDLNLHVSLMLLILMQKYHFFVIYTIILSKKLCFALQIPWNNYKMSCKMPTFLLLNS